MKKVIITRKIELRFNSSNTQERNQFYKDIKGWRNICFKGANQIISNLFFMMSQGDMVYLTEKAKKTIEDANFFKDMSQEDKEDYFKKESKEIYKTIADQEKEAVIGSLQNAFYKVLSQRYKTQIPTAILTSLNQRVFKAFTENRPSYIRGDKSIPSYKNTIPIPFQGTNILNVRRNVYNEKVTKDFAFTLFGRPLRTNLGIDKSNNAYKLSQAFSRWFLPPWVKSFESELNNILKTLDVLKTEFYIKDRLFAVEAKYEKEVIYYYTIQTPDDNGEVITFKMEPYKEGVKDVDGNAVIVNGKKVKEINYKIVSNIKLADSSLKLVADQWESQKDGEKKDITKIFLLAVLEYEKEKYILDDNEIAYATLSPEQPVTVKNGEKELKIGSIDDFMYRRIGIEGARRKTQRDLKGVKGGKGRHKKLKSLNQYSNYEKNVVEWKLHNYSRELIKFCLDNQCKYLHLQVEKLSEVDLKEKQAKLRYWSPSQMMGYIKYKADMVGIEVIDIEEAATDH